MSHRRRKKQDKVAVEFMTKLRQVASYELVDLLADHPGIEELWQDCSDNRDARAAIVDGVLQSVDHILTALREGSAEIPAEGYWRLR